MDAERKNDDLGTPQWIIDRVLQLGPIALDPCSNPWSLVPASETISLHHGEDGLARRWSERIGIAVETWRVMGSPSRPPLIFVNPPYSRPMPWCERIVEAARDGLEVVALVKLDPSTRWSALLRQHRDARCDLHDRVRFEGGAYKAGQIASTLAYFGPRPWLFCHIFSDVGEVQVYRR